MSYLRSIAEWIAANVDRLEAHAKRRHEQLTELEIRSRELARAVLSSLDLPADVQAAMERRKEYDAEMRYGKGRDTYHGTPHLWSTDNATIARHFLANPIRLLGEK